MARSLIESVDSTRLLELIDTLSERAGVVTRVLMQLHVAAEETKFGFTPDQLVAWFADGGYRRLKATHICGRLIMATNTDDRGRVAADFALTAATRRRILDAAPDLTGFDTLSTVSATTPPSTPSSPRLHDDSHRHIDFRRR